MQNIFTHWESVINFTRNDIVFENHNKQYGAYAIRKYYPERLRNAFFYATSGMILLLAIPLLLQKFFPVKINVEPIVDYVYHPVPFVPDEHIMVRTEKPAISKAIEKAVKFVPDKVVDNVNPAEPAKNDEPVSSGPETPTSPQGPENGNEMLPGLTPATVDTTPKIWVSEMPTFPGGEKKLFEFLHNNLHYPPLDMEGTVYLSFIVGKDGKIRDIKVIRSLGRLFDEEASRVVGIMPDWNPGRQNGIPVAVQFKLPLTFVLLK